MNKKFTPNRGSIRTQVVPTEIRGFASYINDASGSHVSFLIWDYSKAGIGLWCAQELRKSSDITMTIQSQGQLRLKANVVWCESDGKGGFRAGVHIHEDDRALIEELAKLHINLKNKI